MEVRMAKDDSKDIEMIAQVSDGVVIDKTILETMLAEIQELKAFKQEQIELVKTAREYSTPTFEISGSTDQNDYMNERVTVQLFKDNGKYKDDVVVAVNGEIIKIKRGVPVSIKRKHAFVIDSTYAQQMVYAELDEAEADKFERTVRAMLEE